MGTCRPPVLRAFLDSGAPAGSSSYTTLVILHGVMWHGANFKRLLPLAESHNTRVIALNRRDYPGSASYTPEERALIERLASSPECADTREKAWDFMRERARELHDYLVDLVKRERIPPARGKGESAQGGIVLVGWSFGGQWMMAFLAHAPSFRCDDVRLSQYVRKVVTYDSAIGFGTLPITNSYHPFHDPATPVEERIDRFNEWATRYFAHGKPISEETLAMRDVLEDPPSTLGNMTAEERLACMYEPAGRIPDGSDTLTARVIAVGGIAGPLKDAALYLPAPEEGGDGGWCNVEVKVVWCERSMWITVWAARKIRQEVEEARSAGKLTRKISLVPLRDANHFAHWDLPEETMRVFLE